MSESVLYASSVTSTEIAKTAGTLFDAWRADAVPPLPSTLLAGLGEDDACLVQAEFVRRRLDGDAVAGYKAGATVAAARSGLGLEAPMSGVLLESGRYASGSTVPLQRFQSLMIETEIGYRIGRAIRRPVANEVELRQSIGGLFPVFELADTGFYRTTPSRGPDLIAANAAANAFVAGADVAPADIDPDALTVTLHKDGNECYRASTATTLDGQLQALRWLVNRMLEQGYRIEPGHILITGALGTPQRGAPGNYRADFGVLGAVEFTLEP